jgi:hypothetical protein
VHLDDNRITEKITMKALAAIVILLGRRETWSFITYGELADRLGHAPYGLNDILNAVGAWCRSLDKLSLVLTVVGEEGEPAEGLYKFETTPENYLKRRIQLYRGRYLEKHSTSDARTDHRGL